MEEVAKFIKERVSFVQYGILIIAFLSAGFSEFNAAGLILGFLGLYLFFANLRMMDDLKDAHKDRVANKDRPIPRGAVSEVSLSKAVKLFLAVMVIFSVGLYFYASLASLLYLLITLYLYLMYKEFFIGESLNRLQILYGLSHQLIVILIALFSIFVFMPETILASEQITAYLPYAICALSGFFQYEILRKMDPKSHPVLKQYLNVYGYTKIFILVMVLMAVGIGASDRYGAEHIIITANTLTLISLIIQKFKPENYKITEGIVSLSLFIHLSSLFLVSLGL